MLYQKGLIVRVMLDNFEFVKTGAFAWEGCLNMELVRVSRENVDAIAPLVALFRMQLKLYKGIKSEPDNEAGKEELLEFLDSDFPVYAVKDNGVFAGYIVCRIDEPCLWVEHIFVKEEYRRRGVATLLFNKAEEIAASTPS